MYICILVQLLFLTVLVSHTPESNLCLRVQLARCLFTTKLATDTVHCLFGQTALSPTGGPKVSTINFPAEALIISFIFYSRKVSLKKMWHQQTLRTANGGAGGMWEARTWAAHKWNFRILWFWCLVYFQIKQTNKNHPKQLKNHFPWHSKIPETFSDIRT